MPLSTLLSNDAGYHKDSKFVVGIHLSFNAVTANAYKVRSATVCTKFRTLAVHAVVLESKPEHCFVQELMRPLHTHVFSTDHLDHFQEAFNNDQHSDVIVKAGDTMFRAHKVILAAHSASFAAMFQVRLQTATCTELVLTCISTQLSVC